MVKKDNLVYQVKPERKGLRERRERVLNAAKRVFAKKGFQAATVDEIAALAGVGKGTIYRRCGDKKELLHLLLHEAADSLAEKISEEAKKETNPVEKFKKVIQALCEWHEKYLDLGKLFFSSVHPLGKKKNHRREEHLIFKVTQDILRQGVKRGFFAKTADPLIVTEGIFHFLSPFFYEELRLRYALTSDQIAEMVFNLFYKGLRPS